MRRYKVGLFVLLLLVLQAGCGSGSGNGNTQPLGLFDDQNNSQASASLSPDPLTAGDMLIVSDQVLGSNSLEIETSGSTGKSLTSKNYDTVTGENCTNVDSMNISCSDGQLGPVRGEVRRAVSIHYDEFSSIRRKGKLTINSEYFDFTYSQNICKRDVQIKGVFQCDIDFDYRGEQDGVAVEVSGLCNTAKTPDHAMQIWLGGKEHRVGYDLVLNLNSKLPPATSKQFWLKDMTVDGTVSFDGVAYPYEAVKSIIKIQCSQ